MKNINKFIVASSTFILPNIVLAQGYLNKSTGIATQIKTLITDFLIPIAFSLALLLFFWGVAQYIRSEGQGKEDGRRIMIWGVVALFVMSSVWGLVRFLREEVGVPQDAFIQIPKIQQ